jgi:5'-3' exonuclease
VNKYKIEKVKDLIRAYGATYYDAPGEADELCALLVLKKKVWACLSEDMDLFVYGCTRVLRYFSLINHSVVLYYMKGILDELSLNQKDFREITTTAHSKLSPLA